MNQVERVIKYPTGQRLEILQGDLTEEAVDAIVNAANSQLLHGGGVAGAIARKGGQVVIEESRAWVAQHGEVTHRRPAHTRGGNLPCKWVIHAVGPVFGEGEEDGKLADAILGSLELAEQLQARTLSFPAISTGIFGFPTERAAGIFLAALRSYFKTHPDSDLQVVRFVLWDQSTLRIFIQAADREGEQ